MKIKSLAGRVVGLAVAVTVALALSVVFAPAANAAENRCPWPWQAKSCSTYANRAETRDMYTMTRGPVGRLDSQICDVVFTEEDGGAAGYCKQLLITQGDIDRFNEVLTAAYQANGCI